MPDVIFAIFDHSIGPVSIFSTMNAMASQKVAMKSLMALSVTEKETSGADGVLPFPDLSKIAYIYLFMVAVRGQPEKSVAALSFLVDKARQMELYQHVSNLKYQAEGIAKNIQDSGEFIPEQGLSKKLVKSIKGWSMSENHAVLGDVPRISTRALIKQIWIFLDNGFCAIHRHYHGVSLDEALFGSFVAAAQMLVNNTEGTSNNMVSMGDMDIYFARKRGIIVALGVEPGTDRKVVLPDLSEVLNRFSERYAEKINFVNDIKTFSGFAEELDSIFELKGQFYYDDDNKQQKFIQTLNKLSTTNLSQADTISEIKNLYSQIEPEFAKSQERLSLMIWKADELVEAILDDVADPEIFRIIMKGIDRQSTKMIAGMTRLRIPNMKALPLIKASRFLDILGLHEVTLADLETILEESSEFEARRIIELAMIMAPDDLAPLFWKADELLEAIKEPGIDKKFIDIVLADIKEQTKKKIISLASVVARDYAIKMRDIGIRDQIIKR